jgi:hypothetical protein
MPHADPDPILAAELAEPAAVWVELATLNPWPGNPRDLSDSVPVVKRSLRRFGFGRPLVAWGSTGERRIVIGHATRAAYLELLHALPLWRPSGVPARGYVPVRWRDDWTEAEAAGYALADNRTAEFGLWDDAKLGSVVRGLADFDGLDAVGWDSEDLALFLAPPVPLPPPAPPPAAPAPSAGRTPDDLKPTPTVAYNLVFDSEAQKARWVRFVRWLRVNREGETNAARIDGFLRSTLGE